MIFLPMLNILLGRFFIPLTNLSLKFLAASFAFSGNFFAKFIAFLITFVKNESTLPGNCLKKVIILFKKFLPASLPFVAMFAANLTIVPKT